MWVIGGWGHDLKTPTTPPPQNWISPRSLATGFCKRTRYDNFESPPHPTLGIWLESVSGLRPLGVLWTTWRSLGEWSEMSAERRRKPHLTYSGWRPEGETVRCGAACVRRSPLETSSGQIGSSVCCGAACVRRSLLETPSGKIGSYLNCTYIKKRNNRCRWFIRKWDILKSQF